MVQNVIDTFKETTTFSQAGAKAPKHTAIWKKVKTIVIQQSQRRDAKARVRAFLPAISNSNIELYGHNLKRN